ncbi:hypothetical protein HK104_010301 [Borealophlyctis nickersoniae]|nr:hypothetical protein HK104_010301 [Borealophlyctis nickersoniae]
MSESYHGGGLRKGKGPSVGSSNAPAKSTGVKMPEDLAFAPTLVHGGKGSGLLLSVATDEDVVYATTLFPGDGKYGAGLAAINSQEDLAILGEYGTQSDLGSGSLSDISLYKDRDIDTPLQSNEDTANNSLDSTTYKYLSGKKINEERRLGSRAGSRESA